MFQLRLLNVVLPSSYKFHRLFPLSQYDLPTHTPDILSFPRQTVRPSADSTIARPSVFPQPNSPTRSKLPTRSLLPSHSAHALSTSEYIMKPEQIRLNPEVDYTRCALLAFHTSHVIADTMPTMLRFPAYRLYSSQAGSDFAGILRRGDSDARGSKSIPGGNVCRLAARPNQSERNAIIRQQQFWL